MEIQAGLVERNADTSEDRQIRLRIGINVGDVVAEGRDLLGDGVNIAARLEALAEPCGIALSDDAYRQVRDRLDIDWQDAGKHEVKNIERPVHVWCWSLTASRGAERASDAREGLALPDKPSIAVLPFDNMSGDPEQDYFADGVTEDIITALSKFRWFFVTARNSTFAYKDTAVDIKQVGRELGVRYVLEGSVRKAGNRIRVTAQLIEAESGNHIWAERYDRLMEDIFDLQDEITLTIASAVEPELANSERDRAVHKPTDDLRAWDLFHQGLAKIWQTNKESTTEGAALIRQALSRDAGLGQAYAYLAFVGYYQIIWSMTDDREQTLQEGLTNANRAIEIDSRDYVAHWALGRLHDLEGDYQSAVRELETAININPSFAHGYFGLAVSHLFAGQAEKTVELADMAIRLSPNDPLMWAFLGNKGIAHAVLQEFDKGIEYLEEACRIPTAAFVPFVMLSALYANADRMADAEKTLVQARHREPHLSLRHMQEYLESADDKSFEVFFEGFQKAALV